MRARMHLAKTSDSHFNNVVSFPCTRLNTESSSQPTCSSCDGPQSTVRCQDAAGIVFRQKLQLCSAACGSTPGTSLSHKECNFCNLQPHLKAVLLATSNVMKHVFFAHHPSNAVQLASTLQELSATDSKRRRCKAVALQSRKTKKKKKKKLLANGLRLLLG